MVSPKTRILAAASTCGHFLVFSTDIVAPPSKLIFSCCPSHAHVGMKRQPLNRPIKPLTTPTSTEDTLTAAFCFTSGFRNRNRDTETLSTGPSHGELYFLNLIRLPRIKW